MSKDEREFLDALRARSIEAAAEILEGVQRLKSMYDEITDDGSGAEGGNDEANPLVFAGGGERVHATAVPTGVP